MPEIVYRGVQRMTHGSFIAVIGPDGENIGTVRHVAKHSPTGMGWGYEGSGPADCARSLLIAALGEEAAKCQTCAGRRLVIYDGDADRDVPYDPERYTDNDFEISGGRCLDCDDGYRRLPYQEFKRQYVAGWADGFEISRAEILRWLAERGITPNGTPR